MSVRRGHAGKVDANHAEVISALRKAGISAVSIAQVGGGVPDIIAGWRDVTVLLEVKSGREQLNAAERAWHESWGGQVAVVWTPEQAVLAVIQHVEALLLRGVA